MKIILAGGSGLLGTVLARAFHHDGHDVVAIRWLIAHEEMTGAVNVTAPRPLANADFMRHLREAAGTTLGLPAAGWMVEVGAALLRTESELVLKSRRVVPGRLLERGFEFGFPEWGPAAADLCRRWPRAHTRRAA